MTKKAKPPEMWGSYEVAKFLGIFVQNVAGRNAPAGMPEPVQQIKATRLWIADDIREFAPGFFARREAREKEQAERKQAREDADGVAA